MIDLDELYNQKDALEMVKASFPVLYKCMVKEKHKDRRVLPRSLRRAYRSKNKDIITQQINYAILKGFTFDNIKEDFEKWKDANEKDG